MKLSTFNFSGKDSIFIFKLTESLFILNKYIFLSVFWGKLENSLTGYYKGVSLGFWRKPRKLLEPVSVYEYKYNFSKLKKIEIA